MTPLVEYIDILTPEGRHTGRIASRHEVHARGLWHRTVHVWLTTPSKDILLQKRAQSKQTHPGLWDMACAGHISAGESSMEAARKEMSEELGVTIREEDLSFLFSIKNETIHDKGRYIDREIHDIYLATCEFHLSDFTLQPDEVDDVRYISFIDFQAMVTRKDPALVPHFSEYERINDYICRP